jgi:hypothetical protein
LNPALTVLTQATYLGGSGDDFLDALAIHPTSGDVYVAGETFSTNFPGTTGGAQSAGGGKNDAFIARLTADLAAVAGPTATPTNTPMNTPTNIPTNTPTGVAAANVPTLSPGPFLFLVLALASAALFLMRKNV